MIFSRVANGNEAKKKGRPSSCRVQHLCKIEACSRNTHHDATRNPYRAHSLPFPAAIPIVRPYKRAGCASKAIGLVGTVMREGELAGMDEGGPIRPCMRIERSPVVGGSSSTPCGPRAREASIVSISSTIATTFRSACITRVKRPASGIEMLIPARKRESRSSFTLLGLFISFFEWR